MPKVFSIITSSYNQLENLKKIRPHIQTQSFRLSGDFEWIIADDGSTDGTAEWCKRNNIKCYHRSKNTGYNLVPCLNEAAKLAEGKYLVWVMGDSFPKRDFLEQLYKVIDEVSMVNGIRFDTDWQTGQVIRPEWRTRLNKSIPWWDMDAIDVTQPNAYSLLTLNSMAMPKKCWDDMGGIPADFDGYGKMDWYMAAWMYYQGYDLRLAPKAILYHRLHEDREDTAKSTEVFEKYLKQFIVAGRKELELK